MNVHTTPRATAARSWFPSDQVTKLRMELASENLPAAGVGYEIFDKSDSFGTTAFVQNINQLARAGRRTRPLHPDHRRHRQQRACISSFPSGRFSRRDEQTPSASVVLKTRGAMDHGQVAAIQHLVAAAVAASMPARVAIVDDKGESARRRRRQDRRRRHRLR